MGRLAFCKIKSSIYLAQPSRNSYFAQGHSRMVSTPTLRRTYTGRMIKGIEHGTNVHIRVLYRKRNHIFAFKDLEIASSTTATSTEGNSFRFLTGQIYFAIYAERSLVSVPW